MKAITIVGRDRHEVNSCAHSAVVGRIAAGRGPMVDIGEGRWKCVIMVTCSPEEFRSYVHDVWRDVVQVI